MIDNYISSRGSTGNITFLGDELNNWINMLGNVTISLDDLNNGGVLYKLLNNKDTLQYMLENDTLKTSVLSNNNSLIILGESQYARSIPKYTNFDSKMIASCYHSPEGYTWHAFNQSNVDWWTTYATGDASKRVIGAYIGYDFERPVYLYKIYQMEYSDGNANGFYQYNIEGSNDGTNWTVVDNGQNANYDTNYAEDIKIINKKIDPYRYWRIIGTSANSRGSVAIRMVQFYVIEQ